MILRAGKNFDDDTRDEIHKHREQLDELRARAQSGRITLVFAAHDKIHNHAIVLRDILLGRTAVRNPHSTTT
jgi:uncharacterized protein YeaO (DUF488 family)